MRGIASLMLFIAFSVSGFGQTESQPTNITEAIQFLIKDCPEGLKDAIRDGEDNDLIYLVAPWSTDADAYSRISEWLTSGREAKTAIEKYYANFGVTEGAHVAAIILISFKNFLNTGKTNEGALIKRYRQIEEKWVAEDKVRYTTDTLHGNYIPKDLDDCMAKLDRLLAKSAKKEVFSSTEKDFTTEAHLGLGLWLRNAWQLWHGSRLTKYFNEKGVYQAESMSGIILRSYYRHLWRKPIDLDQQVKHDQDYWKVVTDPAKNIFPKNSGNLEFETGFFYTSKKNGQCFAHIGTNPDNDDIWIYDYYLGWAKISEAQLDELEYSLPENTEGLILKIFDAK